MSETALKPDAEQASKDEYFTRIAEVSEQMIAAHGKEFAMGTLVLAARWIAANRAGQIQDMH